MLEIVRAILVDCWQLFWELGASADWEAVGAFGSVLAVLTSLFIANLSLRREHRILVAQRRSLRAQILIHLNTIQNHISFALQARSAALQKNPAAKLPTLLRLNQHTVGSIRALESLTPQLHVLAAYEYNLVLTLYAELIPRAGFPIPPSSAQNITKGIEVIRKTMLKKGLHKKNPLHIRLLAKAGRFSHRRS